jgi:hypothetical protein
MFSYLFVIRVRNDSKLIPELDTGSFNLSNRLELIHSPQLRHHIGTARHCIGLLAKNALIDIESQHRLGLGIPQHEFLPIIDLAILVLRYLDRLLREIQLRLAIETQVLIVRLFIQVLFEIVVIELSFLVPVSELGLRSVPISD